MTLGVNLDGIALDVSLDGIAFNVNLESMALDVGLDGGWLWSCVALEAIMESLACVFIALCFATCDFITFDDDLDASILDAYALELCVYVLEMPCCPPLEFLYLSLFCLYNYIHYVQFNYN